MSIDTNEIKVKTKQLADFLVENGAVLLRTEFKNPKKQKGAQIYVFEHSDSFETMLQLWEHEKKLAYF